MIPLIEDEIRVTCQVSVRTPGVLHKQVFQLSGFKDEVNVTDLWVDVERDIGAWLKKVLHG